MFAGLTKRSGSSRDSFDVRVPKVVRVSALYLSTVAVASSTNPSKYTPLGCKDSAQQGLSMAIASYMIEFPARECEHVSFRSLISVTCSVRGGGADCKRMLWRNVT